jgi:hypothetical protein
MMALSPSSLSLPPPPPQVFVAHYAHDPTQEELGHGVLRVEVGDKFGEAAGAQESEDWMYVMRLRGPLHEREAGWVARSGLFLHGESSTVPNIIDAKMDYSSRPSSDSFDPFLGSCAACRKLLNDVAGLWEDDRGRRAKTYKMTVFGDYANVLTEIPFGGYRYSKGIVRIRKVAYGVFAVFWKENFVLSSGSCGTTLQWLPVCDETHSMWRWRKKV